MYTTTLLGLFSVLFAYLASYRNISWGLKLSFLLIFFFQAFRYDFGNDYGVYIDSFINISSQKKISFEDFIEYEPFWILLNYSFKYLGFFNMTIFLAIITSFTYYNLIKKYVPKKLYWLAVFFYIFNPTFLLIGCSAMRQSIAITMFIISIEHLIKKKTLLFFLFIGIASLFHYTALILVLVYFINYFNPKINLRIGILILLSYFSLFLIGGSISEFVKNLIGSFSEKYEFYQNAGSISSGFGFLYFSILLIIVLIFQKEQTREIGWFFKITTIGFLVMPLSLVLDIIGRFGMYFGFSTIVVYPHLYKSIKDWRIKIGFLIIIMAITVYQYIQFFYSETYHDYFFEYKSIFSAAKWY